MPEEKPEKKKVTIGEGFKVMPKAIQIGGKWYKVDPEAWKLLQKIELEEIREEKAKKLKEVV